jgi:iron complex outermembrane receptor protein
MKYYLSLFLVLISFSHVVAQYKITIHVREKNGDPLIGANIIIKGTTSGTSTYSDGMARLENLPDGKVEIEISFIGFQEKTIALVFPQDDNKIIAVELEEGEALEEVIIETLRSSRTIEDIPTRIEVITGEELGEKAAMNSSNIGMLLRETTGIQMQQTSLSSGNLSIRIQGLDGRYTQILKDGFPLYGGFAGGLSIMQIPPLDLRQVELIKGSNSTLYGGGAIAGLVNLVSINPEEDPELNVMFNQTSALGTTGNIFYAQKYGKTGITVYSSFNYQKAYDPDDDGFSNLPDTKSFTINPKFYIYPNDHSELGIGINAFFDDRLGGDMEVIKGNINEDNVFSEKNISKRYAIQSYYLNSSLKHDISIKNSISYFDRKLDIPDYRFYGNQLSSFTEALCNLHRRDHSDWQIGANYYFENFSEEQTDSSDVRDYTHNTIGAFIQNTTDISPEFTVEGGLRTDYNTDYGTFVLPRISFLYKSKQNLTLRIGGALGYKIPTIFTEDAEKLYFKGIAPIEDNKMNPETSTGGNFDINYRTLLFDKLTLSINQMFFLTRLKNSLVLRENDNSDGFFYENADGNVMSFGFETNLKLTYHDFKLFMNYAFINTEIQYDNINNQKPLTPRNSAGLALIYEVEEKWTAGYELYFIDSQYNDLYELKPDFWMMGFMLMRYIKNFVLFINFENFTNVIQSDYEPLVLPPFNNPTFPDIWAPTDGFIFNGGIKVNIL